jgi:hypothetical protein
VLCFKTVVGMNCKFLQFQYNLIEYTFTVFLLVSCFVMMT